MSTTIQVTTYSTIILDDDDIDTIFEDHNLTIDQKKEFLENHGDWMDSYEDHVDIDLTNDGDLSGDDYNEIESTGLEILEQRLETYIEENG